MSNYLRVDEEEVHLEEGEEGLQDGVGDDDVLHAVVLHRRVHRDLQPDEDQGPEAENWKQIWKLFSPSKI